MRDFLILSLVGLGALVALRRPWIGLLLWIWLSLMNPHRFAWGLAATAPVAAIAAGSTLLGLLFTRDRQWPLKGAPPIILALLMVWMTLSWLFGINIEDDYEQWSKVMKINLMVLISVALLRSKLYIISFVWVCALSLAVLGVKGGIFTIATGGAYKVWGPPDSFIADNNHFALALIMTVPMLRFLQMQLTGRMAGHLMTAAMVLVAVAAIGSQSRGALLAITAMALMLWWRGGSRWWGLLLIPLVGVALVSFMPDEWMTRMQTIRTYDEDQSALGRLAAWRTAWGAAFHFPFGVGFDAARPELFARYAPDAGVGTPVAHSIYFQILGQHGFVGLALFLLLWWTTWRWAAKLRVEAKAHAQSLWAVDLAAMCQVALAGYAVGGAFLNLAHYDMPYNIMAIVVTTRWWVQRKAWLTETAYEPKRRWFRVPGVTLPKLAGQQG